MKQMFWLCLTAILFATVLRADDIRTPHSPLDTPIGTIYQAGTTWYDVQHNLTTGRMIGVDTAGYVHLAWMHSASGSTNPRHIRYNVWNPNTGLMQTSDGLDVDFATRAGFTTLAVTPEGFAIPCFHQVDPPTLPHLTAAIDFMPRAGAFISSIAPYVIESETNVNCIWPKVALDNNNTMHVVTVRSNFGDFYYSRGLPQISGGVATGIAWDLLQPTGTEFAVIDSTPSVTPDIAASLNSYRVAIAYARIRPSAINSGDGRNSDLYLAVSEDGGDTWGAPQNLTQFTDADSQRVFGEISVIFDDNDNIHVAFTTAFYHEQSDGTITTSDYRARIYHWNEPFNSFGLIASDWTDGLYRPGQNKRNLAIPSLSVDALTGNLFCSYQKFSQDVWSDSGFATSDAWVSVSTDVGRNWSAGRNVTDTQPAVNPVPAGQSQNERDISMAPRLTYSGISAYLHLFWQLDLDAGTWLVGEGTATENPLYYQRIAADEIPLSPLVPNVPLHDIIQPIGDLTIFADETSLSYTLRWSSRPNANQYTIYKATNLTQLFSPLNVFATVGDTTFTCTNCLIISPEQEYFGVVASHVTETTTARALPAKAISIQ